MKRIIILLFFLFLTIQPSGALTLEGGVTYTVETARAAAFDGVATKIDMSPYKEYLKDPYPLTNQSYIKRGIYHLNARYGEPRILTGFYFFKKLIGYSVHYDKNPNIYYYHSSGELFKIDITPENKNYPFRSLSYDDKGYLISVNFRVSDQEAYVYDSNKKLISHWIGDYRYTEKWRKIPWSKRKLLN